MAIPVALYGSETDKKPTLVEFSWSELVAKLLLTHRLTDCAPCQGKKCKAKFGPAWSPVRMAPGKERANDNVLGVTVAAFDLDHLTPSQLEAVADRMDREGLACVLHSTHNHRPPDDLAARLVLPLSREIRPVEWSSFWREVVRLYALPADKAPRALANIFFLPSAPRGNPTLAFTSDGTRPLDVDALLASAKTRQGSEFARQSINGPPPKTALTVSGDVDMGSLKKLLKSYRSTEECEQLVAKVLTGEPLTEKNRDVAVHQLMSILAFILPADTPWEAVLELVRASVVSMPETPGEDAAHWLEKAEKDFVEGLEDRAQADAKREAERAADREAKKKLLERRHARNGTKKEEAAEKSDDDDDDEDAEEEIDWRKVAITKPKGKDGERVLENIGANVDIILNYTKEWKGVVRFNDLTKELELHGGPLSLNEQSPSTLASKVNNWISHFCELRVPDYVVRDQLIALARENSYDPAADYLSALEWDGQQRADLFLHDYFGVEDNEYTRAVSAKWLISAVARVLEPGCKVDTVLVLEGAQGAKKSQALSILGGKWYSNSPIRLDDKDSKLLAAQNWIIELAELSSLKKTDLEAQKNFLSMSVDKFRPPYAPTIETFLRRCVFVGTTNEKKYLVDVTGNRRFWPVKCGTLNLKALKNDRNQLWAEAVVRYKAKEQWWFTADQEEAANRNTVQRLKKPTWSVTIYEWWTNNKTKRLPELTTSQVAAGALNIVKDRFGAKEEAEVERALQFLGFVEVHRDLPFPHSVWLPPEGLKNVVSITGMNENEKKRFDRDALLRRIANATIRDEIDDADTIDDNDTDET